MFPAHDEFEPFVLGTAVRPCAARSGTRPMTDIADSRGDLRILIDMARAAF